MSDEIKTGSNALDGFLDNLKSKGDEQNTPAGDTPAQIETARLEAKAAELGKTIEEIQTLESDEAGAAETARLEAKAAELGKTVDEVKALEEVQNSEVEKKRLEDKAKELGKTVDEVKAIEEQERIDTDAQAELDAMNDFEYTLHHDLEVLGLELTDEEYDTLGDLELDKLDFSNQEDHGKYVKALTEILKPRFQDELIGSYKPETVKVMNFIEQGGDITKYAQAAANSYADLEVTEDDKEGHTAALANLLMEESNGAIDEAKAKRLAALDIADGDGFNKAKAAVTKLKELGAAKVQSEQDAAAAEAQKIAADVTAHNTRYNAAIDKGELTIGDKSFKISKDDATKLKTYRSTIYKDDTGKMFDRNGKPTTNQKDAMSLLDVVKYNLGVDGEAMLDLLAVNKGYEGLAERSAKTTNVSRIRSRGKGNLDSSGKPITRNRANTSTGDKTPKLSHSQILGMSISE